MGQKGRASQSVAGSPCWDKEYRTGRWGSAAKAAGRGAQPLSAAICLTILNFLTPGPHIQVFYRSNLGGPPDSQSVNGKLMKHCTAPRQLVETGPRLMYRLSKSLYRAYLLNPRDVFYVAGPGEHIHRLNFPRQISSLSKTAKIPGQGTGVTGDINQPLW